MRALWIARRSGDCLLPRIDLLTSTRFASRMTTTAPAPLPLMCLILGATLSCAVEERSIPERGIEPRGESAPRDDAGIDHEEDTSAPEQGVDEDAPLDATAYPGDFVLYARTNFSSNPGGAYGAPADHFFSGESVQLSDDGAVAFRLTVTDGLDRALYVAGLTNSGVVDGRIVYRSPDEAFLGQPSMNAAGKVAFELRDVQTPGLFLYDPATGLTSMLTSEPYGAGSRSSLRLFAGGGVGFRASFATGRAHVRWDEAGAQLFAREQGLIATSDFAFLFSPGFNDNGDAAGQVRFTSPDGGSEPDAMVLWPRGLEPIELARDVTRDPLSSFASFDATAPSLNARRQVAFIATLVDGTRGVFLADGGTVTTLVTTTRPELDDIEPFGADLNDEGLVVFRAQTPEGRAIFVTDGKGLVRVVGEHDLVPTDLGTARIDEYIAGAPVFDGPPKLNRHGDVAFLCALTPPDDDQVEWGTGVFVARALRP